MLAKELVTKLNNAFGNIELPLAFWFSETPNATLETTKGCYIYALKKAREGYPLSFDKDTIKCGGGRVYAGLLQMPERLPNFVSIKEKYKQSPEMVIDFIEKLGIDNMENMYLNFSRIDTIDTLDNVEGIIFFSNPDILSGLLTWTFYDTNAADAVSVPFGSGCSSIVAQVMMENRRGGKRTFLGMFDPSARPAVEKDILTFGIPMSRLIAMYDTIGYSCLSGTHAWLAVKERINQTNY